MTVHDKAKTVEVQADDGTRSSCGEKGDGKAPKLAMNQA